VLCARPLLPGGFGPDNVAAAIRAVNPAEGDLKVSTDRGATWSRSRHTTELRTLSRRREDRLQIARPPMIEAQRSPRYRSAVSRSPR
jgi:hypothetical protein